MTLSRFTEVDLTMNVMARPTILTRLTTNAITHVLVCSLFFPDSDVLEKFLIHSKNSLERAKGKLESYYSARSTVPDMFQDRDPLDPAIRDIAKVT